jgi:hypothetical protein
MTDVTDPASSPHGASFWPLPPRHEEPQGINPFPEPIPTDFYSYLVGSTNRTVLTSVRRAEMREILRNPNIQYTQHSHPDRPERGRLQSLKSWTLKYFELDDGQIYRSAETVRGTEFNRRYAACMWDAFDLIAGVHRGLHHAGKILLTT